MPPSFRSALLAAGLFGLAGCAVGPDFQPPEMAMPAEWSAAPAKEETPVAADAFAWWRSFTSGDLEQLLDRVEAASPDLHARRFRIEEAWANRRLHLAGMLPHADLAGEYRDGSRDGREQRHALEAAWEVDVFGRHFRRTEASTRDFEGAVETWRNSLLFLRGEVALYYADIRVNQGRLVLLRKNIVTYREIVSATRSKAEEGLIGTVELQETLARLRAAEAEVPRIEAELAVARNGLARVLAIYPAELDAWVKEGSDGVPQPAGGIQVQLPAEVIRARPDIRRAERVIAREVAEVGVAVADVYPRLSLNGALSYESFQTGGVSTILRGLGSGADVFKRLFHAGADRARIERREAILQQVIRDYESLVYRAVMEIENALAQIHFSRERILRLSEAVAASHTAFESLRAAYSEGLIDVRDLLGAQQERFELELELLFAQNDLARATILLYKAAGGDDIPTPPVEAVEGLPITGPGPTLGTKLVTRLLSLGMDSHGTIRPRPGRIEERTWLRNREDGGMVPAGQP